MVLLHCNMHVAMQHSGPHIAITAESALATLRRSMLPLLLAMLTGWLRKRVSPPRLPAKPAKRTFRGPRKRFKDAFSRLDFFVVTAVPFAIALRLWWTKQDTGIEWGQVRANAGSLVILSIL